MTLDHLGCSKTRFGAVLDHFEALFGPNFFSKTTVDHLGCWNTHSEPVLRLFVALLRLHLASDPLEMPHFRSKGGRQGGGRVFPARDPGRPRMLKRMFWAVLVQKKGPNRLVKRSDMQQLICPLGSVPIQNPG